MDSVAFIGMGIMGLPMAGHLLTAGYPLTIQTRTKSKAEDLIARGAKWADTPAEAARHARFVFTCVPDTPDVQQVLLGPHGVASVAAEGQIIVDHSTISPSATREMAVELEKKGAILLDAPVSGGDIGAKNATLTIMVGGNEGAYERVRPLLLKMGKTATWCGPSGSGQLTKLANQILVVVNNLAMAEALTFARANGLDLMRTIDAVAGGGAGSWQLSNLGPRIVNGDFNPGFMIKLQQKDLNLVLAAAREAGVNLEAVEHVHALFAKALEKGWKDRGTQALYEVVREDAVVEQESADFSAPS